MRHNADQKFNGRAKRANSDLETEVLQKVADIQQWSDEYLDCQNDKYTFDSAEKNKLTNTVSSVFIKQQNTNGSGKG